MVFKIGRTALLIILLLSSSVLGAQDDWVTYRHDNARTAKSQVDLPPPFLKVRSYPVGDSVDNEAAIRGNYAYVGTSALSCLNLSNGVTEWTVPTTSVISTTPLAIEQKVIFGTDSGTVVCVNSDSAKILWTLPNLGKIVKGFCFDKNLIYFTTALGLIAAVKLDGSFEFKIANKFPISCAPTLSDGKLYVGDDKGSILCYNASNGKIIWRNDGVATDIIGGLNITNGKIYFGSFDNHVSCLDTSDGHLVWSKRVDGWVQSPPITINDIAYFQIRHTKLVGYDAITGALRCEYEYQPSKSELMFSGNTLFIGSNRRLQTLGLCPMDEVWYYEFRDEQVTSVSMGGGFLLVGTSLGRIHQFKAGPRLGLTIKKIEKEVLVGADSPSVEFNVTNDRKDMWQTKLEGDVTCDAEWIYITEPLFSIPNGQASQINVKIMLQELPSPGSYTTELVVSSNGGSFKIPFILHYVDPNPPKVCFDQTLVDMGSMQQGALKKSKLVVSNCGKGTLHINITTRSFGDWLVANKKTADIEEGKSDEIILIAKGDKLSSTAGDDCGFSGVVTVGTNIDTEPFSIPVTVRCYGIPIPTTINIQIGNPTIRINSMSTDFNPPSYINAGRTMVPLRLIGEAFFARVDWFEDTKTIMISSCTAQTRFTIGSKTAEIITKNGIEEKELDVPPEVVGGRTFIPIRAVSDILGGKTAWDGQTRTVTITYEP